MRRNGREKNRRGLLKRIWKRLSEKPQGAKSTVRGCEREIECEGGIPAGKENARRKNWTISRGKSISAKKSWTCESTSQKKKA